MLRGSSGGRSGLPFQLDGPHTRVYTHTRTHKHVHTRTLLGVYPEVPLSPRLSELEENLDHLWTRGQVAGGHYYLALALCPSGPTAASGSARLGASLLPARSEHINRLSQLVLRACIWALIKCSLATMCMVCP